MERQSRYPINNQNPGQLDRARFAQNEGQPDRASFTLKFLSGTLFLFLIGHSPVLAEAELPASPEPTDPIEVLKLPDEVFNVEGLDKASLRIQMRSLYNHAVLLNYSSQYGQIRPLLHQMNRISPDAPETHYLKSMDFYHRDQIAKAIVHARKAVDQNPALDPAWNFLGFLHSQAGNDERALEAFLKAIQANPYHSVYRFNAANTYSRISKPEEALEQIEQAIRIRPNYSDAYYLRALILREQKNFIAAFESMLLAEKTGSNDVAFFMNFIDMARKADKPEKLLELMETTQPMRDFRLYRMRAIVFSEYGECNRAVPLLRIIPQDDMTLEAYRAYGKCLLIQDQPTDPYIKAWKLDEEEKEDLMSYLENLEITNKKWPEIKDPIVNPPK
ncbi:MAG: hypothetical protein CMF59_18480 [Leptospiraceae bacterium]|nr:hypothetical protein [Leptospiraceae bacterium]